MPPTPEFQETDTTLNYKMLTLSQRNQFSGGGQFADTFKVTAQFVLTSDLEAPGNIDLENLAHDPQEFIHRLEQDPPHIAIFDLHRFGPNLSPINQYQETVLQAAKIAVDKGIPCIFITDIPTQDKRHPEEINLIKHQAALLGTSADNFINMLEIDKFGDLVKKILVDKCDVEPGSLVETTPTNPFLILTVTNTKLPSDQIDLITQTIYFHFTQKLSRDVYGPTFDTLEPAAYTPQAIESAARDATKFIVGSSIDLLLYHLPEYPTRLDDPINIHALQRKVEFLKRIAELNPQLKIIVLTHLGKVDERTLATLQKMADHIGQSNQVLVLSSVFDPNEVLQFSQPKTMQAQTGMLRQPPEHSSTLSDKHTARKQVDRWKLK